MKTTHKRFAAIASLPMLIVMPQTAAFAAECGQASWYEIRAKTASGEMMNPDAMTAAHPSLPFGTKIEVVNKKNGRSVTLRVNDRGPFVKKRIVDVSRAAAGKLGFRNAGHTQVCLTVK